MKYFFLIFLSVVWGSYYLANKIAVENTSIFSVGLFIRIFCFILLFLIFYFKKSIKDLKQIKNAYKQLFIIGFFGFCLDFFAFLGLMYSTASNGSLLLKTDVLFTNIISLFLGVAFGIIDWVGTLMMLLGIVFVLNIDLNNFVFNPGDIFFIISGFLIALNAFIINKLQLRKVNPIKDDVIAFYNNFFAMTFFFIFSFIQSGKQLFNYNKESIIPLLIAGVCQTSVYLIYYYNMKKFPIWIVRVFLLFMPVFVTIISIFIFDEVLLTNHLLGIIILLFGAFFIIYSQRKRNKQIVN